MQEQRISQLSRRLIQEQAIKFATELGLDSFTGSNGWLQNCQSRHNVRMSILSEAADVDLIVVRDMVCTVVYTM